MAVNAFNPNVVPNYIGLSGDAKPTGVTVGALFIETDTGKTFITGDGTAWAVLSVISLTAGSAVIGKVSIDQTTPGVTDSVSVKSQGYSAAVSVTRPANATAYTANDVIGATAAAITFPTMGPSGGQILITSAELEYDVAAIPSGLTTMALYLYNVTPPSALADNAAFDIPSGDRASFIGKISLGTLVDEGSTLYVRTNAINAQVKLSGTSLFGYLATAGAFTPAGNSEVVKVTLYATAL